MSIEQTREILSHEELSDADIVHLLGLTDPEECELLRKTAYDRTTELMGSFVYYRGLIEFSNICTASCRYCGIRRENHDEGGDRRGRERGRRSGLRLDLPSVGRAPRREVHRLRRIVP